MRIPAYSAEKTAVNLTQESFGQATDSEDLWHMTAALQIWIGGAAVQHSAA